MAKLLRLALMLCALFSISGAMAQNYPDLWVKGECNGWNPNDGYKFSHDGANYSIHLNNLNGEFKISNYDWTWNLGTTEWYKYTISASGYLSSKNDGLNFIASDLHNVDISFVYSESAQTIELKVVVDGIEPSKSDVTVGGLSGSLPVLYINVYDEQGNLNNEIISKDLDHKNYFTGEYWLDINGCEWLEALGGKSIGSKEEPLPLEIKARGNWTRRGFAKKPFKLKLGKKQSMLGMTKSKHYAILAHADDNKGYLRNFTGFNLGKRIGLPWTPEQQPVEVVINGDYRGMYFLTESIRVGDDRIMIEELADEATDPALISGGYLVELDNYDEENQIRMTEKGQAPVMKDMLRITFDTPEVYSDIQRRFVTDQFTAMNDLIGENSDNLWRYMDLDDVVRYYIVEELISHIEAFHGSTYLYRDRGEGQKWHFSPLWDCGNAFNGPTNGFFYNNAPYGATWIPSLRLNQTFNNKLHDTWLWFMSNCYDGIYEEMKEYANHIKAGAIADHRRWNNQPVPWGGMAVQDNSDMDSRLDEVTNHLKSKANWLKNQFGDYTLQTYAEPMRDESIPMALPEYAVSSTVGVSAIDNDSLEGAEYFSLQGIRVAQPKPGEIYIIRKGGKATKAILH